MPRRRASRGCSTCPARRRAAGPPRPRSRRRTRAQRRRARGLLRRAGRSDRALARRRPRRGRVNGAPNSAAAARRRAAAGRGGPGRDSGACPGGGRGGARHRRRGRWASDRATRARWNTTGGTALGGRYACRRRRYGGAPREPGRARRARRQLWAARRSGTWSGRRFAGRGRGGPRGLRPGVAAGAGALRGARRRRRRRRRGLRLGPAARRRPERRWRSSTVPAWEHEITTQLVPLLHAKFEALGEASADVLQGCFGAAGPSARGLAARRARAARRRGAAPRGERLEAWALRDAWPGRSRGCRWACGRSRASAASRGHSARGPRRRRAQSHRSWRHRKRRARVPSARWRPGRPVPRLPERDGVRRRGRGGGRSTFLPSQRRPRARLAADLGTRLEFRRGEEIYVGCRSGNRSASAVAVLRGAGFARAVNVTGGINAWRAAGLPLVPYAG